MNWDEKALAVVNDARAMFFRPKHLSRFEYGAQWQREQLRAPEAIERMANFLYKHDHGEALGEHIEICRRPAECSVQKDYMNCAKAFIAALLGENK